MNKILMDALIEQLVFLEFSTDAELDPDTAVKQMENLAEVLRRLSGAEVLELKAILP